MKLKDLTIRTAFKRQSNFLSSPSKYFYPMNCAESTKGFTPLSKKKPRENIPDFLKEIIICSPSKPRVKSQVKIVSRKKSDDSTKKRSTYLEDSRTLNRKQNTERKFESPERFLYKPIALRINPRSKVTLYTAKNFRVGSEAKLVSSSKSLKTSSNFHRKIQSRGIKTRFLVPEFTEKLNQSQS